MPDVENPPVETTPLVDRENPDEPPLLKDMKEHSLMERLVGVGAVVGLTSSVAAMAVESNPVVYVSGAIGAVVAPMAALQQTKLTQVEALRQTNERITSEVAQLKDENERLQTQVASLEESVVRLQDMSKTLETIRAVEGQSVDELEKQLKESESILDQMQDNLRGDVVQTLISIVLAIDHDGDMCLSDAEIDTLCAKIEGMSNKGIDLNEEKLRTKLVENGRSLNAVMEVIKNMLDENTPPEDSIFAFINKENII
jgi:TolA-binding protein